MTLANDVLIPPEIYHDELWHKIKELAARTDVTSALDVGSSSGLGSTAALVEGLKDKPEKSLDCIESSDVRFRELCGHYQHLSWVKCHLGFSCKWEEFATETDVRAFFQMDISKEFPYPIDAVLGWWAAGMEEIRQRKQAANYPDRLIERIISDKRLEKDRCGWSWDLVVLDGGEFTGHADACAVMGSRILVLDDIKCFKNAQVYSYLMSDVYPMYRRLHENRSLRNGFAIFERIQG